MCIRDRVCLPDVYGESAISKPPDDVVDKCGKDSCYYHHDPCLGQGVEFCVSDREESKPHGNQAKSGDIKRMGKIILGIHVKASHSNRRVQQQRIRQH